MLKTTCVKSLSIFTSLALLISSLPLQSGAVAPTAAMPEFVQALTPPEALGYVDTYYKGNTEHPVVLIQDLHANYGVQKKIRSILEYLQPKVAPTGRSMVLGMEGAWGKLDLAPVHSEPEKVRRAASDFLLKEAEISAMEHFAALSESNVQLVGIDDPEDYFVHTQLFRKSLAARLALAQKTDKLRQAINNSKADAPKAMRRLWKLEEDFHSGRMGLSELSKSLGVSLTTYKAAEEALAQQKLSLIQQQKGKQAFSLKNVVEADQNLSLLGRLLRQQLTLEEVQYASKRVPAMLMTVQVLLPGENMGLWNDTIRAAMDHYAVAILRDKPMAEHALALAQENTDTSIVIVTGGFHTAGIASFLKNRKMSYMVVAPIMESHTVRDEELYVKRMLDIHVTDAEIGASVRTTPQTQTVSTVGAVVSKVQVLPRGLSERGIRVWDRAVRIYRGASPVVTPSPDEVAANEAVHALVTTPEDITKVPGALDRAKKALREWYTGNVDEKIELPATPAATAASMELVPAPASASASPAPSAAPRLGKGPVAISMIGATAILGSVALADAAQNAVSFSGGDSSPLAVGIGLAAVAGMAWFGGPKKKNNKARLLERARDAIKASA